MIELSCKFRILRCVMIAMAAIVSMLLCPRVAAAGDLAVIADLNRTPESSRPDNFLALPDGKAVFFASAFAHGREPWVTDGSLTGTRMLRDIVPGTSSGTLSYLTNVGTKAYFIIKPPSASSELWSTDGTPEGTGKITSVSNVSSILGVVNNSTVLCIGGVGSTAGLYAVSSPTGQAALLRAGLSFSGAGTPFGNKLLFLGRESATGAEPWVSDGTAAGTQLLADVMPGTASGSFAGFTAGTSLAYFMATSNAAGQELWKTDGTPAGTTQVADVLPGVAHSRPASLVTVGDDVFFVATHPTLGRCVYSCTSTGTPVLIFDSAGGTFNEALFRHQGGVVFASRYGSGSPSYLWKVPAPGAAVQRMTTGDGIFAVIGDRVVTSDSNALSVTDLQTPPVQLLNIRPELVLGSINGALCIRSGGLNGPYQLMLTDGTAAGSRVLTEGMVSSSPALTLDGRIFLSKSDEAGIELWAANTNSNTVARVLDIDPRTLGADLTFPVTFNDHLYVITRHSETRTTISRSAGTPETTGLAVEFDALFPHYTVNSAVLRSTPSLLCVIVRGRDNSTAEILNRVLVWDGTSPGAIVAHQTSLMSGPESPVVVGGDIWFGSGTSLMRTDGFGPAVVVASFSGLVDDILPLPNGAVVRTYQNGYSSFFCSGTLGDTPTPLPLPTIAWSGSLLSSPRLFIRTGNNEVWVTDGTIAGTLPVAAGVRDFVGDLPGGDVLMFTDQLLQRTRGNAVETIRPLLPAHLCEPTCLPVAFCNGAWLFSARTTGSSTAGAELWRSDGTSAGTHMVVDLHPGAAHAYPRSMFSNGQTVHFVADSATGSGQLWKTDGTLESTRLATSAQPYRRPGGAWSPVILGATSRSIHALVDHPLSGLELAALHPGIPDCNSNQMHDAVDPLFGILIDADADGMLDTCCPVDIDGDAQHTIDDIFVFLNGWFNSGPRADFDRDGVITIDDIFIFLNAWFVGCP